MELASLLKELIRIPSISREESRITEFIATIVEGEIRKFPISGSPAGRNVIAVSEPHPGDPFILLNGHHDTVAPVEGWNTDPFIPCDEEEEEDVEKEGETEEEYEAVEDEEEGDKGEDKGDKEDEEDGDKGEEEGGRLYGLGTNDMKAGLAILISLYEEFKDGINLIFTSSDDEETDSMGSFSLVDRDTGPLRPYRDRISGVLITEPTGERVMLGARGRYALSLIVHGKAAHGARPHLGINAVDGAAKIALKLEKLKLDSHPQLSGGSYCILGIQGGTKTLSVPDRCELLVDRHYTQHLSEAGVITEFRELLKDSELPVDISLMKREVPFLKPYARSIEEPFIREFMQSLISYDPVDGGSSANTSPLHSPLSHIQSPSSPRHPPSSQPPSIIYGASVGDYNIFGNLMPTIVYGPSGGQHHSANEFVYLPSVEKVYLRLRHWMNDLLIA